ncbi:DUF7344 domain-containing protein [Salinigranum halophilum]|jgi:hypothetical protein|uniref:DUF7344 domain-containing protein n=1 Tax=Salinigranum halophilum TaxID=2565931 RepID=UPI0010A90CA0|nr:hypothetical protein [Salinigranum halophilum]
MTAETLTDALDAMDETGTNTTVVTAPKPENGTESVVAVLPDDVEPELARDTLFELLKNQRRRDALQYLKDNDGWATLSDMAEHIAAKENDLPLEGINSKQRKRVYIGLYQCHLPKMADAGVVDYDKNRGTIELRDLAAQLYPYLEVDSAADAASSDGTGDGMAEAARSSAALAGIGVAALAGVAGVPGFALLSPTLWAVVCAVSMLVVAALPLVRD